MSKSKNTEVLTAPHDSSAELIRREKTASRLPQYTAALTASLAALSMGTTLAWTSQLGEQLQSGVLGFLLSKDELGWVGSLMPLGAAALSLLIGPISDLVGRKLCMLLLVLPATAGWSLIAWPQSILMLYIGRFLTGMVAGAFCVLSLLYSSEIAQKEIRGALGSYTQLMISFGILLTTVMAKFIDVQGLTIICGAIPLVFGATFIFMPESPVYLMKKKKVEQARQALLRLRGNHYDVDGELKEIELDIIKHQSHSGIKTIKESMKKSSSQKACVIGFGLMIFRSTTGIDAITAYTSLIFENTKMGLDPKIGTIILNIVQVTSGIFQSIVVDRSGRKILLWVSALVMSLCLAVVGICFMLRKREMITDEYFIYIDYLPLAGLVLFIIAYSLGLGPIPWLMMGEIFPQEIKTLAASVATFINWITAFAVTKIFLVIEESWGNDSSFFIFAAITASTVVFTLVLIPETKNKTFDEIQQSL